MSDKWNWASAKWWKFDFHNHTPASNDYGKGSSQILKREISAKDWLLNYMRAGIDCVAITDHNSGVWIDPLKQALSELENDGHVEFRPLYLFPGVEITVQGNIHILAIFPCDRSTSDIDSLLGAVKYRATKGTSDGCSECSAVEVIDAILQAGGLAIPAHADKAKGLLVEYLGNTLEQVLDHKGVLAIEVANPTGNKPPAYISKKINWAEVLGTDSHHPSGITGQSYPGSSFTWVKMSQPSFDGLKLALIDGVLSLKRSDIFTDDPNTHGQLAIESIIVDDAKYLGRGSSFDCRFNPWLNTIIGGRGTGKSTVLEFLRIALQRKNELPANLKSEFQKYSETCKKREDDGLLTDSSKVTVYFRKDGVRFRVRWINANNIYEIEEESAPDIWNTSQGDIAQRFPVRIYSQKQIFELAKHPESLLRVIDDAPEVNFRNWKLECDELVTKYLSIRAQEREVQAGLQEESVLQGQLDDVRHKLEVFEKAGHADVLQSYQLRQNQDKAIGTWEVAWEGASEQVRTLAQNLVAPEINLQHFSSENDDNKELLDEAAGIKATFQTVRIEIENLAAQIDNARAKWLARKASFKITKKIAEASLAYTSLLGQLTEVGAGDPSGYEFLVKQRQELEEKLKRFNEKRSEITRHQMAASDCLQKLYEHRSKISELRELFLKKILVNNSYVKISVLPYGNKAAVDDEFRNLIDRSNGGFDRVIGSTDSEDGLLSLLYINTDETIVKRVEDLKSTLLSIYSKDEAAVNAVNDKRFVAHIQGLKPEQMDRLRCWFPEDSLNVQYSLKNGQGFKPVEQGSPGQKTAALLAFILSYGDEPLLLDQPEDDLDNHLIYNLIVSQLREIKQKRQVVVVTHNANIVVNGDAENVVALDVKSGQTRIVTQGGLQDSSVRNEICHVMEGGKEAFDQRYQRINAGWNL